MIRKLKSGEYRLYSRKVDPKTGRRRNLGTFKSRAGAEKHEKQVQFFSAAASPGDSAGDQDYYPRSAAPCRLEPARLAMPYDHLYKRASGESRLWALLGHAHAPSPIR